MHVQNVVVETIEDAQKQQQESNDSEKLSKVSAMKAILIKKGEYTLSNSFVLPSFDLCLIGEEGTVLAPKQNVLAIIGVGNKDIKCSKCGYMLAMKIKRPQLQNLAIKCPSCGSLNQL
jgi:Zn finger protein HypA/HybF involved in hydrogenase expression